jgi:hypothetical protein
MDNYKPDGKGAPPETGRLSGATGNVLSDNEELEAPSPYMLRRGTRHLTEKGKEERGQRLKNMKISALSAVSRKRNRITELMRDGTNLHLVKTELSELDDLFRQFRQAHLEYYQELTCKDEEETEHERFASKETSSLEFRQQVMQWITIAERRITDEIDSASRCSRRSSSSRPHSKASSSSTVSARTRERIQLAEMLAEKSMLKERQELRAAEQKLRAIEQELTLDTEIAKSRARERTYAMMEVEESARLSLTCIDPSTPLMRSTPRQTKEPNVTEHRDAIMKEPNVTEHRD